jgi:hypothetical protein
MEHASISEIAIFWLENGAVMWVLKAKKLRLQFQANR